MSTQFTWISQLHLFPIQMLSKITHSKLANRSKSQFQSFLLPFEPILCCNQIWSLVYDDVRPVPDWTSLRSISSRLSGHCHANMNTCHVLIIHNQIGSIFNQHRSDFYPWKSIKFSKLIFPFRVHVLYINWFDYNMDLNGLGAAGLDLFETHVEPVHMD